MNGLAVIDTNLLALLVIGSASKDYISSHKRINSDFTTEHFDNLVYVLGAFDEIILLPQVVAETSNLIRQIKQPAKFHVQQALKSLVEANFEFPATSREAVAVKEYFALGIADACLLQLCSLDLNGLAPTLVTIDGSLANIASSSGYNVLNYRELMS